MKSATEYTEANESTQVQHSFLDNLVDKFGEFIDQEREVINFNFPLSGSDEQVHVYKHEENGTAEKSHRWTSFLQVLETEFPLSGGEAGW